MGIVISTIEVIAKHLNVVTYRQDDQTKRWTAWDASMFDVLASLEPGNTYELHTIEIPGKFAPVWVFAETLDQKARRQQWEVMCGME